MECKTLAQDDFSTRFLSFYEEVKRRLKEKKMHATLETLEKCQAMLLVFLEKGRPMRPYELIDSLIFNPAYAKCKDARRMVFYILEKLLRIGVLEKTAYAGREGFYQLATSFGEVKPQRWKGISVSHITDPMVKPLLVGWKKAFELRNIIKLWNIPSLAHAMVWEISSLLRYVDTLKEESSTEGGELLDSLERNLRSLLEEYLAFAEDGKLSPREAEIFYTCSRKIKELSKSIW
jgi:hypothetical protein